MEPAQQVARLGKLIERLGNFPDRDVIHQVTETAKVGLKTGGMELAERMTACVMDVLDDAGSDASPPAGAEPTAAERRVPLFYAMDSVVKNVGDVYGPLFGLRVKAAFEKAFAACHDKDKTRLHHVLRTWNEKKIFVESLDDLNALVAPWHAEFAATAVAAATAQAQAQARQQQLAAQHAQKLSTAALAAQRLAAREEERRRAARQQLAPPVAAAPPPPRPQFGGQARVGATASRAGLQAARAPTGAGAMFAGASAAAAAALGSMGHSYVAPPVVQAPDFTRRWAPPPRQQQRRPDAVEPPAKRSRVDASDDDDALTRAARAKLAELQAGLGEANPMTLEELRSQQPDIHARLLEEAANDVRAAARSRAPTKKGEVKAEVSKPATPEKKKKKKVLAFGPDFAAALREVADHADRLLTGLKHRGAAYQRGEAASTMTPDLAAGPEQLCGHLVDVLKTRFVRDAAKEAARLKARAKLAPDDRDAHDAAHEPPPVVVAGDELAAALRLARKQAPRANRPVVREPGVFELTTESLAGRANSAAVDALYHGWPDQCKADGTRFMSSEDLAKWMDVVYRKNQLRDSRKKGTTSRPWGPSKAAWKGDRDGEPIDVLAFLDADKDDDGDDDDDDGAGVAVPSDAEAVKCRICGEKFDIHWDTGANEWILTGAVRVTADDGEGVVVHRGCRDTTCGKRGTLEADALLPVTPRGPDDGAFSDSEDDAPAPGAIDADALYAAARAKLDQLQASLGESDPLTLEQLHAKEPEIYAQLIEEAESELRAQLGAASAAAPEPAPEPEPAAMDDDDDEVQLTGEKSAEELRAPTDVVDLSGEDDAPAEGEPAAEEPAEGEPAAGDDAPEPGDTAMNETD